MKIAFDAKRAFSNTSGLGNYSRTIVEILGKFYPENEYSLFTPKLKKVFSFDTHDCEIVSPKGFFYKKLHFLWRTYKISKLISNRNIDIYHGLSHELPRFIEETDVKSVVTIHDLIFLRYPELYNKIDIKIYTKKVIHACSVATKIIAISEQTKADLVNFLNLEAEKIEVIYQGCNRQFYNEVSESNRAIIRKKYNLPLEYLLIVGTIEKRKNLLILLKALKGANIKVPLVVIGRKTPYFSEIELYIKDNGLVNDVHFYHDANFSDFPAIYQMAKIFVYPSIFEGFGIPIVEALNSKVPVITSKGSCFKETGGEGCIYINPFDEKELSSALVELLENKKKQNKMIEKGYSHVLKFRDEVVANNLISFYKSL